MKNTFIVTDFCMWENNKKRGEKKPHAIQVVDAKTGHTRFIKTGSRIRFLSGDITEVSTQEMYNLQNK